MSDEEKGLSLWTINTKMIELFAEAEGYQARGEDVPQEVQDQLVEFIDMAPAKIDNCVEYYKSFDFARDVIKSRICALNEALTKVDKANARFDKYLLANLDNLGKDSMQGSAYKISKRKSQSLTVHDEDVIPSEFLSVKEITTTVIKPDKKKITDHIKADNVVPGCELVTKYSIKIK